MRKIIIILILLLLAGCAENQKGIKLDGVSVGVTRLDTELELFGQKSEIKEYMPTLLLNFKFFK